MVGVSSETVKTFLLKKPDPIMDKSIEIYKLHEFMESASRVVIKTRELVLFKKQARHAQQS